MSSTKKIVGYKELEVGNMYKIKSPSSEPFFLLEFIKRDQEPTDHYFWVKVLSKEIVADCLFYTGDKFVKLT